MVELRKRKAQAQAPVTEKRNKKHHNSAVKQDTREKKPISTTPSEYVPKVGDTIVLNDFGGQIETNEGRQTTLKDLVENSQTGVILFTYPKASTPGCTKQACMFGNNFDHLTSTGLSIYGLSADSAKANTTFKTKQSLPYLLLCDPTFTLITALGLKKSPKGITRGVFAINKKGKVLLLQAGGPDGTVEAARQLVATLAVKDAE
ncbi:hypothetical protein EYZ11_007122 [Aspergillus tanneri]|uniref:thioredoxin-dependent peroxiredoxin n=1 Tax=Aspergillus tanneri TaxID=1220188 RepID=A0A4S3JDR2_9EURO|nr:hypothetical protein EYZ11_007122 [Aspergillus tanneri]